MVTLLSLIVYSKSLSGVGAAANAAVGRKVNSIATDNKALRSRSRGVRMMNTSLSSLQKGVEKNTTVKFKSTPPPKKVKKKRAFSLFWIKADLEIW